MGWNAALLVPSPRAATGRASAEERRALGGVAAQYVHHVLDTVAEVVSSTVGCQGQAAPGVALILVGRHPAALAYTRSTDAAARVAGITLTLHEWPEDVSHDSLEACLMQLSNDDAIHGIVLQLPLPPHLDEMRLVANLADEKDVDGIKERNLQRFLRHVEPALSPAIALACDETLRSLRLQPKLLQHAQVSMLGIPPLLRAPLQCALNAAGWHVKACAEDPSTARAELALSSVLLVGERRPDLVAAQWVRDGCVILDLGLSSCAAPTTTRREGAADGADGGPGAAAGGGRVEQRDVRWLCCSDGLSAITAALRMRNASHSALLQQGFLDCRDPVDLRTDFRKGELQPQPSSSICPCFGLGGNGDDTGMTINSLV